MELKDIIPTQSNPGFNCEILEDGEYYVFSQQKEQEIRLGYVYTTWCGSPYGMHIKLSPVGLGKPLPLFRTGDSEYDIGQLKIFNVDSRNILLIDDVYKHAMSWLKKTRRKCQYPQIDESLRCTAAIIQVNQGILSAFYGKDDYLKNESVRTTQAKRQLTGY